MELARVVVNGALWGVKLKQRQDKCRETNRQSWGRAG